MLNDDIARGWASRRASSAHYEGPAPGAAALLYSGPRAGLWHVPGEEERTMECNSRCSKEKVTD